MVSWLGAWDSSQTNSLITHRIDFIREQKDLLQYQSPLQVSSTCFSWFRLTIVLTKWLEAPGSERDEACIQTTWIHWINNKWVSQKRELCTPRMCYRRIACKTSGSEWADQFLMNSSSFYLFSNQPSWKYWTQRTSGIGVRTLFCFVVKNTSASPEEYISITYVRWSQKYSCVSKILQPNETDGTKSWGENH